MDRVAGMDVQRREPRRNAGASGTLLDVRDLTIHYQVLRDRPLRALHNVTFTVCAGQVIVVIGESGSGKTTLGFAIVRLLPRNATVETGSIVFRQRDLLRLREPELEKIRGAQIGFISQEPVTALNPVMRVGDQISEVIRVHRKWDQKRCREATELLLREVRLTDANRVYSAYPHELSGGQRQRAVIAQALACQPALVIADEPLTAMDSTTQVEILTLMKDVKTRLGMAALLITHDPTALSGLADRLLVIYGGIVVEDGPFVDVYRRPLHPYTRYLLAAIPPIMSQHKRILLPVLAQSGWPAAPSSSGCPFEPRCPDRMPECGVQLPEEVMTGGRRVRCFRYGA
jgi:oligopeptide/dipeptide ABC transporter ATP-binding protein